MPGGVGVLLAMWTVHCLSALVSWTHLFLNDFDILYIIILSDLFITIIFTYYFLFFQVASATATMQIWS